MEICKNFAIYSFCNFIAEYLLLPFQSSKLKCTISFENFMRLIYDLFNFFLGVGVWVFGGLFHSSNHGMRKYESK